MRYSGTGLHSASMTTEIRKHTASIAAFILINTALDLLSIFLFSFFSLLFCCAAGGGDPAHLCREPQLVSFYTHYLLLWHYVLLAVINFIDSALVANVHVG